MPCAGCGKLVAMAMRRWGYMPCAGCGKPVAMDMCTCHYIEGYLGHMRVWRGAADEGM